MCKPHKHAAIIKAWADGAKVQGRRTVKDEWRDLAFPNWRDYAQYRVKPEKKPDMVKYAHINGFGDVQTSFTRTKYVSDNIQLTFDGETGKLKKAEII